MREVARSFLFAGQSSTHVERLARAGCIAYLAIGRGEVRDVDLGLYTDPATDRRRRRGAPYAYVRVCGAAGLVLHAGVSLYAVAGSWC